MSTNYTNADVFDISKIRIRPGESSKGMTFYPIHYEENPCKVVSPPDLFHWGLNDFNGNKDFTIAIPLHADSQEIQPFMAIFEQLDAKFASDPIFKKKNYKPILKSRELRSGAEVQIVQLKVPKKGKTFEISLFDKNTGKQIFPNADSPDDDPSKYCPKGSKIQFVFEIKYIWVKGADYGCKLHLLKAKVIPTDDNGGGKVCDF